MLTTYEARRDAYAAMMRGLGNAQRAVYTTLRYQGPTCNRILAERLKRPVNEITPRVGELRKMGLVVQHGDMLDPQTRKRVTTWRALAEPARTEDRQLSLL